MIYIMMNARKGFEIDNRRYQSSRARDFTSATHSYPPSSRDDIKKGLVLDCITTTVHSSQVRGYGQSVWQCEFEESESVDLHWFICSAYGIGHERRQPSILVIVIAVWTSLTFQRPPRKFMSRSFSY